MHGEIIIAELLAKQAAKTPDHPPQPPRQPHSPAVSPAHTIVRRFHDRQRDQERQREWREDFLHRTHLSALHMAWSEFGAANAIEDEAKKETEVARVRRRWGSTLDEALERMAKVWKWQTRVYAPRVAEWYRRQGILPPL